VQLGQHGEVSDVQVRRGGDSALGTVQAGPDAATGAPPFDNVQRLEPRERRADHQREDRIARVFDVGGPMLAESVACDFAVLSARPSGRRSCASSGRRIAFP
jgi:hypothetical protein